MEKEKDNENQTPIEGIVLAHEITEQGTRLVVLTGEMESVPRKVKLMW